VRDNDTRNAYVAQVQLEGAWMRHDVVSRAVLAAQAQTCKDGLRRFVYFRTKDGQFGHSRFVREESATISTRRGLLGTRCAIVRLNEGGGADIEWKAQQ
jgi:hypothetical protein